MVVLLMVVIATSAHCCYYINDRFQRLHCADDDKGKRVTMAVVAKERRPRMITTVKLCVPDVCKLYQPLLFLMFFT
jgi:hypothetical protein